MTLYMLSQKEKLIG